MGCKIILYFVGPSYAFFDVWHPWRPPAKWCWPCQSLWPPKKPLQFSKIPSSLPGGGTAFFVSLLCRFRGHSIVGYQHRVTWGATEGTWMVVTGDAICQSLEWAVHNLLDCTQQAHGLSIISGQSFPSASFDSRYFTSWSISSSWIMIIMV